MVLPKIQPLVMAAANVTGLPNTETAKSDDAKLNMITFWGVHNFWKNKNKNKFSLKINLYSMQTCVIFSARFGEGEQGDRVPLLLQWNL